MAERKLRLEVLQGDDQGEPGFSRVPRWQSTGQDAIITNDITGSVMKIRVTDSRGKLISIIIGENGTIQEVKDEPTEPSETLDQHDGTGTKWGEDTSDNNPNNQLGSDAVCSVDLSLVKEEMEIEEPEPYSDLVGVVSEGYNDGGTAEDRNPMDIDSGEKKPPDMILEKIKTEDTEEMAGQFETVFVDPSTLGNEDTEQDSELSNFIFETNDRGIGMPVFCRLCATRNDDMIDIFGLDEVYRNIIDDFLPVTVKTSDYLPRKACRSCIEKLKQCHSFHETVADAQKQFVMLEEKIFSEFKSLKNYPKVIPLCNGQLGPNENSELEKFVPKPSEPKNSRPVTRRRKRRIISSDESEEEKNPREPDAQADIVKCRICGGFFGTPKSCYLHSKIHAMNGYVPCSMCDKIFKNRKDAHSHSWDHILPLSTHKMREMMKKKINDLKLNAVKNVKGMVNAIEENRKKEEDAIKHSGVKCRICAATFLNARSCYKHSITHATASYHPCCMCDRNFNTKTEALVHSLEHITDCSTPGAKPVQDSTPAKKPTPATKGVHDLDKYLITRSGKLPVVKASLMVPAVVKGQKKKKDDECDMVKCRLCGMFFGTGKSCYAHSAVHNSENYYPCSMCEASFTTKEESYTHSIKHTMTKFQQRRAEMMRRNCYIDPVSPATKIILDKILEKDGGNEDMQNERPPASSEAGSDEDMVKCRICGTYFGTHKSCYTHSASHNSKDYYPCSMCDKSFTTHKESYDHSLKHTVHKPRQRRADMAQSRGFVQPIPVPIPENDDEEDDMIEINKEVPTESGVKCRICGILFQSVLKCYKHAKVHCTRDKYPCCICDKVFMSQGESYVHSLSHQTSTVTVWKSSSNNLGEKIPDRDISDEWIRCSVCKMYLASAASFHSHCYSHITKDNFPCCICNESFKTDGEYCLHSIKHSNESGTRGGKVTIPICDRCGKRFPSYDRLKFHWIYHSPKAVPGYCQKCDRRFVSESSLYDHIQASHTEAGEKLECTKCQKQFESREKLHVHNKIVHLHKKIMYECSSCNSRFHSVERLKDHKLFSCGSSKTKRLKNHVCSYCGKTFFRKNRLMIHEKNHADEESRKDRDKVEVGAPFNCSKCAKTFPNTARLKKHAILHNADQSFACYRCDESFESENDKKEHMNAHHKNELRDCDICGETFSRFNLLDKHKRVCHNLTK